MDEDFERLKVICNWENGWGKRVSVSRSHRNKRIGEKQKINASSRSPVLRIHARHTVL